MKIAAAANDGQWDELVSISSNVEWIRINPNADAMPEADAYFILDNTDNHDFTLLKKPVFINSVIKTCKEINAASNCVRINGWKGFLQRSVWEAAGQVDNPAIAVMDALAKKYIEVPDEPGLVAARPVAMIINEAYYAWGENVGTKEDIDTAMKLGTNYPFGPFEWASIIGLNNIYHLLLALQKQNSIYSPAPALVKEATA